MKILYLYVITMLSLVGGYAQEDSVYINPKTFILDEMVVSANRWEQNVREISGRVAKVNASLVRLQNPQTAADLLSASGQVFIQKSQLGGGSPMIRGFATNRVLLVVDGVRMNNAIFRSGNVQNVISIDANAIEEAEVVFGPGSVIYGSDAIGGVMDFHTISPKLSGKDKALFQLNGLSRFSSANREFTNHFDFNIGFKKWAFLSSYSHSDFDDLRMGSHGPDDYLRPDYQARINGLDTVLANGDPELHVSTGYQQNNLMQKVLFRPTELVSMIYSFHYSATSEVPRYDRLILKNGAGFTSSEWYYGPQKWIMHSLQTALDRPNSLWDHARFMTSFQDYDESRHNRTFGSGNKTNRFENVKSLSANMDVDKKLTDLIEFFYGAEYILNKVNSSAYTNNVNNGAISTATTRYPDGAIWQSVAGYLHMKYKFSEVLIINGSARVSNVQTKATYDTTLFDFQFTKASLNKTSLNGSVGLIFNPTATWKLYTNVSTGFRAPNVDDIGKVFDSQPGDVVIPNPDLDPEYAYNVEAGLAGKAGNFEFDMAGFYTLVSNVIARGVSTFNGADSIDYDGTLSRVLSMQNIVSMTVAGLQTGISWKPSAKWKITSNLNWQKGKEKYPDSTTTYSPTHVAPLFGSTHILLSTEKIKLDVYANYNGGIDFENLALTERADRHLYAKDGNGNPYSPSWWTLNLKASWQASRLITVDGGLENIFDKRYRPYSSGIAGPGRNAIISFRIKI